MKTQEWIPYAHIQPRTVTAESSSSTLRTEPLVRAVNGIAILAIVFGGLGAGVAGSHSHHHAGHANGHRPASAIHHRTESHPAHITKATNRPWMY